MMNIPLFIGLIAAMTHVLSGPDHLAAVTPLVFDRKNKHWQIGFFWGIGHIIGMLLIGVLFYFFKDFVPVDAISSYSEQFVGVILIGIGLWSFYRIRSRKKLHIHPHFHQDDNIIHIHRHIHDTETHTHVHSLPKKQNYWTSLSIGIIHGFAGIAHFVLLLPVLGFETKFESIQYMIGFAIGILVAMVLYTGLLGRFEKSEQSDHTKPIYTYFQFWSGIAAIVLGIYWIIANK